MTDEPNRQREFYESQTNEQLDKHAADLRAEHKDYLVKANDFRTLADGVQRKIELIMSVIGARNYETMMQSFVLTEDHIKLLREYGSEFDGHHVVDRDIVNILGWKIGDDGITEVQERNIARLLHELKYAQDYINRKATDLLQL